MTSTTVTEATDTGKALRYVGPATALDGEAPDCERPKLFRNVHTGENVVRRCRATRTDRCEPCGTKHRYSVRSIAHAGTMKPGRYYFVTWTAPGKGTNIPMWNACAGRRFAHLIWDLRRRLSDDLEYFRAAEVQKRGALHYHVLIRLPLSAGRPSKRWWKHLGMKWGFGYQIDVQELGVNCAGSAAAEKAAWYVAKYASKASADRESAPWADALTGEMVPARYQAWTQSGGWAHSMRELRRRQQQWAMTAFVTGLADPEPGSPAGEPATGGHPAEGGLDPFATRNAAHLTDPPAIDSSGIG